MAERFRIETDFNVRPKNANRLGLLAMLLSTVAVILGPASEKMLLPWPWSGLVMLAGVAGWIASLVYFVRLQKFRRGIVEVQHDSGVRFEGREVIPRAAIKNAYFAPGSGRFRSAVRLLGDRDRVLGEVAVEDPAQAERVLDALGVGVNARTARFRGYAPVFGRSWVVGLLGLMVGAVLFGLAVPIQAPWLFLLGLPVMIASSVIGLTCNLHVGADGLLIGTRIAPQFVPWSEVHALEPYDAGVLIKRREGKTSIRIPMAQRRFGKIYDHDAVNIQAFVTRARLALTAYRRGDQPNVAALIARRGRSTDEWLRALFAHLDPGSGRREGDHDFRTAPILDDQLWSIVESPTAETSARAGAAAILARAMTSSSSESDRARFRVAADACTEPHLRVVLDQTADGASNEDVEKSLLALAEEEQRLSETSSRG